MTMVTPSGPHEVIGLRRTGLDRIPASHLDLVACPPVAALTTLMPDGSPQTSVVWCDYDGTDVRVNTMRGFQKERNMRRDPRVVLLTFDPRRPLRYLEVRGVVDAMREDGALGHLDALASRYAARPIRYFGECIPASFAGSEIPVLCLIRPTFVTAMDARGRMPPADAPTRPSATPVGSGLTDAPASRRSDPSDTGAAAAVSSSTGQQWPTASEAPAPVDDVPVPDSHVDLLERPVCGVLTTLLPDGQPHSCLVWVDHDGTHARVNTTLQRVGGRDLAHDPRLSLLVVDPEDTGRFLQIRGRAELVTEGAVEHLDVLTRRYTSHPRYYGHVYPLEQAGREQRVVVVIHARRITLDAIHA